MTAEDITTLTLVGEIGLLTNPETSLGHALQRLDGRGLIVCADDTDYVMATGLTPTGLDVLRPHLAADYPVRKLTIIR